MTKMITTCRPVYQVMGRDIETVRGTGRVLSLDRPVIMGIVNATPDSFFDGGRYDGPGRFEDRIDRLLEEGADIVDIGGESTRPGAAPVPAGEELGRIRPEVEYALDAGAFVSVDTRKPEVASEVLGMGVHMINSVEGISSDGLREAIAGSEAAVVIMHMRGAPVSMQDDPTYGDVVGEVREYLSDQVALGLESGIDRDRMVIDPGIGFGKTLEHNLTILRDLGRFLDIGQPVMIGTSRKSVIGKVLDLPPEERLEGSVASCVVALARGASFFRVHDVLQTRRALDMANAILG
jgi:dihydropteroate synthase